MHLRARSACSGVVLPPRTGGGGEEASPCAPVVAAAAAAAIAARRAIQRRVADSLERLLIFIGEWTQNALLKVATTCNGVGADEKVRGDDLTASDCDAAR
jgi:hypothetical protein